MSSTLPLIIMIAKFISCLDYFSFVFSTEPPLLQTGTKGRPVSWTVPPVAQIHCKMESELSHAWSLTVKLSFPSFSLGGLLVLSLPYAPRFLMRCYPYQAVVQSFILNRCECYSREQEAEVSSSPSHTDDSSTA